MGTYRITATAGFTLRDDDSFGFSSILLEPAKKYAPFSGRRPVDDRVDGHGRDHHDGAHVLQRRPPDLAKALPRVPSPGRTRANVAALVAGSPAVGEVDQKLRDEQENAAVVCGSAIRTFRE